MKNPAIQRLILVLTWLWLIGWIGLATNYGIEAYEQDITVTMLLNPEAMKWNRPIPDLEVNDVVINSTINRLTKLRQKQRELDNLIGPVKREIAIRALMLGFLCLVVSQSLRIIWYICIGKFVLFPPSIERAQDV